LTPKRDRRMSWLVILSFILSFTPIVSGVLAVKEIVPYLTSLLLVFFATGVGIASGVLSLNRINKSQGRVYGSILAKLSIAIGFILWLLWMINIPGWVRFNQRAKEVTVKTIAHALQASIEDYKNKHHGERPQNVVYVESSLPRFVNRTKDPWYINDQMKFVKNMQNPLDPKQTYTVSGGGLVDGEPHQNGQIGYIAPSNPSEPYRIIAGYTDDGKTLPLLTLVEERPKAESDSGVTKRP